MLSGRSFVSSNLCLPVRRVNRDKDSRVSRVSRVSRDKVNRENLVHVLTTAQLHRLSRHKEKL
jgi:hypothetical protein